MPKRNHDVIEPKIGEDGAPLTADQKRQLAAYIGEFEVSQREIDSAREDQKTVMGSAKEAGFDTKAMRTVLKQRRADRKVLEKHLATVDVYKHALGELADLPLGQAAINKAADIGDDNPRQADVHA